MKYRYGGMLICWDKDAVKHTHGRIQTWLNTDIEFRHGGIKTMGYRDTDLLEDRHDGIQRWITQT